MLVQMIRNTSTTHLALIHPNIKTVRLRHHLQSTHRLLSQQPNLSNLLGCSINIIRNMPIRHHQNMPRIIRIKIQQGIRILTPAHNQRLIITPRRPSTKRAGILTIILLPTLHIGAPVRRPEPLKSIRNTGQLKIIGTIHDLHTQN